METINQEHHPHDHQAVKEKMMVALNKSERGIIITLSDPNNLESLKLCGLRLNKKEVVAILMATAMELASSEDDFESIHEYTKFV